MATSEGLRRVITAAIESAMDAGDEHASDKYARVYSVMWCDVMMMMTQQLAANLLVEARRHDAHVEQALLSLVR